MKNIFAKTILVALIATVGVAVATPAHADWYDRHHHFHHGYPPAGWVYNAQYGYYYRPRVVVAQPPVIVASPPPAVVVAAPPPPPPVVITQPTYVEPAPVGLSLGVHIR